MWYFRFWQCQLVNVCPCPMSKVTIQTLLTRNSLKSLNGLEKFELTYWTIITRVAIETGTFSRINIINAIIGTVWKEFKESIIRTWAIGTTETRFTNTFSLETNATIGASWIDTIFDFTVDPFKSWLTVTWTMDTFSFGIAIRHFTIGRSKCTFDSFPSWFTETLAFHVTSTTRTQNWTEGCINGKEQKEQWVRIAWHVQRETAEKRGTRTALRSLTSEVNLIFSSSFLFPLISYTSIDFFMSLNTNCMSDCTKSSRQKGLEFNIYWEDRRRTIKEHLTWGTFSLQWLQMCCWIPC